MQSRREWLGSMVAFALSAPAARVPLIDLTDLYHPHQDVGDNLDLIAAYALPGVDLKAVVLDCTGRFREPVTRDSAGKVIDDAGPREPGVIPVAQLNYIFDRDVPFGYGPFTPLASPRDAKRDAPRLQQTGIELVLDVLRRSREKVEIVSFGSARVLAAAWNREPGLLRAKCRRIHLSAGSSAPTYLEWNVALDPAAIVALANSDLPIYWYPCATKDSPFELDRHNTYYKLLTLDFIRDLDPRLQSYLAYAFTRSSRIDFLRAMDERWPVAVIEKVARRKHNVWETAIWAEVAGLTLVRRKSGEHRLVATPGPGDTVLPTEFRPCTVTTNADGNYSFQLTRAPSPFRIHDRVDPERNQTAMRDALPALYRSFSAAAPPSRSAPTPAPPRGSR